MSARRSAPTAATASASRRWPPPQARSSSPSPSFARGRSSPPCSTRAGGWTRPRCAVICSAWIEGVSTRKAWRPRQGPGQRVRDQPLHGLADLQGHRRGRQGVPRPVAGSHLVPLPVRRRHVPGRESGAPGGLPGAGGGHRRVGPGPPGDPGTWPWGTPRRSTSGSSLSCGPCANGGSRSPPRRIPPGSCWSPVTRTPASGPRSGRSFPGPPGSAAAPRFARNITSRLGSARSKPVNALVSTIFAQTSQEAVAAQYKHVIDALRDPFPEIARMLIDAEPDLTAFAAFPREHWTKIRPQQPHRAAQPRDQAPRRRRPGLPRQRVRHPPDRLRPVRATRSGSTANAATSPRPHCDT